MKRKKRILMMLLMALLIMAMPASAQAAFKVTAKTGVTLPTTIKKGAFFNVRGAIKANGPIAKISCTIYNSAEKCVDRYDARPYTKAFDLRAADPYLEFNKLAAGKYSYRICIYNAKGVKRRVVNKKFTVVGTTTTKKGTIKITSPIPSQNVILNKGRAYSIGGTITSSYNLKTVKASILNNKNKVVYTKTVSLKNQRTYKVNNSALDSAMLFDKLDNGTYTYYLSAADVKGTSVTLVKRTITVKTVSSNTNTNNSSTGSNTNNTNSSNYLDYNGIVTQPSGFKARTGRPSSSNKYFYNKSYNIYYQYNGLAPTGKAYYGNQYVLGNCTWYACGRAMELVANAGGNVSKVKAIFGGDPVGIYNTNASLVAKGKGGFSYGTTPKIGALAIFNYGSSGDAHIAVVENIVNGVPYVSESGYTVGATMPKSDKSNIIFRYQSIYNWAGGRSIRGYIYLI